MMADAILILGAGGHGRVVADLARQTGRVIAGFADHAAAKVGQEVEPGVRVLLGQGDLLAQVTRGDLPHGITAFALGVGHNAARHAILSVLPDARMPVLLHPAASVSRGAHLGAGTVVLAGAVVNTGARIGRGVIINSGAIVEHDCVVGDAAHVSPGAVLGGGASIGLRGWVGANATVLPLTIIGDDAIVGAGAVCLNEVAAGTTVVGNPARTITRRES